MRILNFHFSPYVGVGALFSQTLTLNDNTFSYYHYGEHSVDYVFVKIKFLGYVDI